MSIRNAYLGIGILGSVLCGVASAQQTSSSGITQKDSSGQSVIQDAIRTLNLTTTTNMTYDLSSRGVSNLLTGGGRNFGTGSAAASGGNRWNLWAAVAQNRVGSSFQPLQSGGDVGTLTAGLDYRASDNVLLGVALAGDRSRMNLNYVSAGRLSGDGYTIAPYVAFALNRSWTIDASVGYGRSDYDVSGGGVSGSFLGTRTFGNVAVNFRQQVSGSRWQVSGRGALMTVSSRTGSFTASNSVLIDNATSDLTQLRLGGQLAYAAGQVSPFVGLTYVYDVRRPGSLTVGGQTASGDRDAWIPAIGLRFTGSGSIYGGLQMSSERGRSEFKNDQVLFNMGVRF